MTYIEIALNRVRSGVYVQIRELPNGKPYWHVSRPDGTGWNFGSAGLAFRYYLKSVREYAPVLGRGAVIDLNKAT